MATIARGQMERSRKPRQHIRTRHTREFKIEAQAAQAWSKTAD
jgi:hypothetical protein